jgi:hypothetical protein
MWPAGSCGLGSPLRAAGSMTIIKCVWRRDRLLVVLWLGVGAMLADELVDLRWHLTHDEFETGGDQLRAHWLTWLGALVAVAAGAAGTWRGADNGGYRLVAGLGLAYAGLAVWHFVAHVEQSDPAVAHHLIAVSKVGIVGAAVVAAVKARETWARGRGP